MSHDDSTIRGEDQGKEVVRDELQDSMGLEVDGRGIEAVESQPTTDSEPVPSIWKKYRLLILVVALVCVIGGVVGGAVGGTVGKHHNDDSNSPSATTSSARYVTVLLLVVSPSVHPPENYGFGKPESSQAADD
jgi:hypothetical protein